MGPVPPYGRQRTEDTGVPSARDFRRAAESLRRIAAETAGLPEEEGEDRTLQTRLELAADILDAAAEQPEDAE